MWRYLDRRRMVATTLRIAGPPYIEVTVTAAVTIGTGAGGAKVPARVVSALQKLVS